VGALCGLTRDPRRFVLRMFIAFVSVELVLVGMHLLVTDLFAASAALTTDGHISGFDLDDEATLAVWFSSFQLLLLSGVCLLNAWSDRGSLFGVSARAIWARASLVFLFIAIDETAGIHEVVGAVFSRLLPVVPIHPSMWWTIPYALGIAPVLLYLWVRVREHPRFAVGAASGAIIWFCANSLERVLVAARPLNVAMEEGLEMFGASMLLITFSTFFLDVASADAASALVAEDANSVDAEDVRPVVDLDLDVLVLDAADAHVGC